MNVNILKLLEFYDVYKPLNAGHVSAITTFLGADLILGIVRHYFEGEGYTCRITNIEPAAIETRQRLDRWLIAEKDGMEIWYQTEVKNWSVYTTGVPRTLEPGMNARRLNSYAYNMYLNQWDEKAGTFTDGINVGKVLLPMEKPADMDAGKASVRPLVCYWYPISGSPRLRLSSHFFTLQCRRAAFDEVDIFSASLYLRHLAGRGITTIDAGSPKLSTTLNLMKKIIEI